MTDWQRTRSRRGSRTRRRGGSLIELLTAIPLAMVALGCAAVLMLRTVREARDAAGALSATRELRHARQLMLSDLSALEGRDLVQWRDSLVEFRGHLGLLVACTVRATDVEVAPAPGEREPSWIGGIRAGDELAMWRAAPGVADSLISEGRVANGAPSALGAGPCEGAWSAVVPRRWRIPLTGGGTISAAGSPIVVRRRVQLVHYRSNNAWWLGRRTRDASTWETLQPIAGPLRSAVEGGLRVRAVTSDGRLTTVADSVAVLQFRMRAAAHGHGGPPTPDSTRLDVALRAALWTRGRP